MTRIHTGIVEHRHGFNTYAGRTEEALEKQIAGYVREYWDENDIREIGGLEIESFSSDSEMIRHYFDHVPEEWYISSETKLI